MESVLGLLKSLKIRALAFFLMSELAPPPHPLHSLPSANKASMATSLYLSSLLCLAGKTLPVLASMEIGMGQFQTTPKKVLFLFSDSHTPLSHGMGSKARSYKTQTSFSAHYIVIMRLPDQNSILLNELLFSHIVYVVFIYYLAFAAISVFFRTDSWI